MTLDELIEQHTAQGGLSLLLQRGGQEVLRITRGEGAAGQPMTRETILLWLSSGKPITAVALARLVERNLVHLDDRVAEYLPYFGAHDKETITLRHLLTHTAGLHKALHAMWELPPWDQTLSRICDSPLPDGFVPGEHAAYDPAAAWYVLGEIIARASGETFPAFVQREVFERAGMTDAAFSYTDAGSHQRSGRLARYYNTHSGSAHPLHWNEAPATLQSRPGGSFRATIDDMARFYSALFEGRLLHPETLAQFTSPQRGPKSDRTFGVPMDWGLGIMVNNGPRAPYNFGPSASAHAFGHGGQQSSIAFADPDTQTVFAAGYTTLPGEKEHHRRMNDLLAAVFDRE